MSTLLPGATPGWTGPWHSPQSPPKGPNRAAGTAATGKQVHGEPQHSEDWILCSSACHSREEHRRGAACHGSGTASKRPPKFWFLDFFPQPAVGVRRVCTAAVPSTSWAQPSPHFLIYRVSKQSLAVIDKHGFKRKQKPLQFHTWLRKVIQ